MTHSTIDTVLSWLSAEARLSLRNPAEAVKEFWETFGPGGKLHPRWFLENQYHLVLEVVLLLAIVYLLLQSRTSSTPSADQLTENEIDQLCQEWQPAPLVPPSALTDAARQIPTPVVEGATGALVTVDGVPGVVNLASGNFWGLSGHPEVQAADARCVDAYGVGSCGPRGFYGTIDVHLRLEEHLARFMRTEEAIIYSFDVATVPSVLPAFASRKDVLVLDDAASWPLRNGAHLSRARVHTFKHNDMADLERVLRKVIKEHGKKPLNRRFIVVEGIYHNTGDLAPLAQLFALKEAYKFRLVVDESLSFGVLGASGRGACEHAGLEPDQVEVITASMGTCLASVGGFCVGSRALVDHQRLSGNGYCFSASLPPVLAESASATLALFERSGADAFLPRLHRNARLLRSLLSAVPGLRLVGGPEDEVSPVLVLQLSNPSGDAAADLGVMARLRRAVQMSGKALLALDRPSLVDTGAPGPALKCLVSVAHEEAHLRSAAAALHSAAAQLLAS